MKAVNLVLPIVVFLIQFHGVRSGSAETCQMIDMGGMTSNRIGTSTLTTPFTQDKSTLFSFLNNQAVQYMENNAMELHEYTGFNFHLIANDTSQPQKGPIPYSNNWFTNITIGFSGWFTPLESGEYTFSIDTVSDAAGIYIFDNQDMLCCDDLNVVGWLPRAVDVINIPTDPEHTTGPKSTTLEEGKNYLFFIVYVNFSGDAELSISVTDPSGQIISDLGPYLGFPSDSTCDFIRRTSMVYSFGTDSITSTYSTSYKTTTSYKSVAGFFVTEHETIYYVVTPQVSSSSEILLSSSDIPSSSSSELLTSYVSTMIKSSSVIINSSSELLTSDVPSMLETSSELITPSSEIFTSNHQSSSSEVTTLTSALESSTSINEISFSEFSNRSTSDESSTSAISSSSERSEATTGLSMTSAEYSSASSEDVASSSSVEDVDTNGVKPTSSSDILSKYYTGSTFREVSATISDGPEDIETTVPGGSIYQNSTLTSSSGTVESSGHYYGSSSGLVTESSSTNELDGNGPGSAQSAGGSAVYSELTTVTNIFGQTTTTVVTCTGNVCQQTGRADEELNGSKTNSPGTNTVALSPAVTTDAPVATSKQIDEVTDVPQTELSSTGKYEGTEVLQMLSNSASSAPTTTLNVVAAPNGSVRIQKCLITSMLSCFLMVLLL